jgi:hypothetical protein
MPINYRDYHPKWTLIRRMILRRAGNCCEQCSARNGSLLDTKEMQRPLPSLFPLLDPDLQDALDFRRDQYKRVILTVAHLDHDRNNNRFHNLRCLCQKCHLAHDLAQRVFSFKYGKETQYQNGKLF